MHRSPKPIHQQVIVITGASSGIGLATARAAASRGARLVLASRNDEVLQRIADEFKADGCDAIHVPADVGRREEVQSIADAAIERFGGFDTWVNNAGVSIFGRLEEVSEEDHQRLFQTNFWGVVHGSLVALPHLKAHGGTLINLGSVASDRAFPMQGMYCASKHAVKGFTDALRMELEAENAPVTVTLIKPAAIDTPFPHHARNYMEHQPQVPPPVYPVAEVARAILFAATHAKRDIHVGGASRVMTLLGAAAPRAMDRLGTTIIKQQQRNEPAQTPAGALHHAGDDGRARGDHPGYVMRRSYYNESMYHPVLAGTLVAMAGVAAAAVIGRSAIRRSSRRRHQPPTPPL